MRTVIALVLKDLRLRTRYRSAFIPALCVPIVLAALLTGAFRSYDPAGRSEGRLDLAFANLDHGRVGAVVEGAFDDDRLNFVRLHPVASAEAARELVGDGVADTAIVVPADFSERATGGGARLEVIDGPGRTVENAVTDAIARGVLAEVEATRVSVAAVLEQRPGADVEALTEAAAGERIPIDVVDEMSESGSAGPAAYFGPSMGIMALFFTIALAGKSLWHERRLGLLRRLEATSTSLRRIMIAKALAATLLGFIGALVLWLTMTVVFSTSWGSPPFVLLLLTAVVVSSLGITLFVAGLARSEERLDVMIALLGFAFGLLGGNLIPYHRLPAALEGVSKVTPNAWALRGFVEVGSGASTLGSILPSLLALVAIGVVFGAVGVVRLEKVMTP
jgi:ABC-2 type transport system permease protein